MLWQLHCESIPYLVHQLLIFGPRGFEPSSKTGGKTSGANSIPVASTSTAEIKHDDAELRKKEEKEERRRKKVERREEKYARKELKKLGKSGVHSVQELDYRSRRRQSRSRSPRYRSTERRAIDERRPRSRSRSRTPPLERRITRDDKKSDYDAAARDRERERDRRRWELNAERELPQHQRRY